MDKELAQLQAPKRTQAAKQNSFNKIQAVINERQKYQKRSYYGVFAAAVILFVFLMASFFNGTQHVRETAAASPLTIEKGYVTANDSTADLTGMTNWYYFDKNEIDEEGLSLLQPFVTRLYELDNSISELPETPGQQLLLVMSKESAAQLAVLTYDARYLLVDMNTKQSLPLTIEEARDIEIMMSDFAERSLVGLGRLIVLSFLIVVYIAIVLHISPKRKERLEGQKGRAYFFSGIGMYIVYMLANGLSLYYFHASNGLFIASMMAMLLLIKRLIEYYNGRFESSIYEVPILFLFTILFTFVKCL